VEESVFPRFGRVAIVDDKIDEVLQIQNVLAKKGVPYVFYNYRDINDADVNKVDGIRLLFLDIRLEDGTSHEKNLLTILASTVEKIIPIQNGPYAIILWTNEYGMKDYVIKYLNDSLDESETTKPSHIGAFDKKEFINKPTDCLEKELVNYYKNQNMLAFLMEIENNVMTVPANVVKMINYSFVKGASNQELVKLFLRFAQTETGNCDAPENATKTVLRLISDLIRDRYMEIAANDNMVDKLCKLWQKDFPIKLDDINNLLSKEPVEQAAIINTVLNVNTYSKNTDKVPGKVYKVKQDKILIDTDILAKSTFGKHGSWKLTYEKKPIKTEMDIIEIDITPSCDYAQGKSHMLRTLYGYIVYIADHDTSSDGSKIVYKGKINHQSPCECVYVSPFFFIRNRLCVLLLNTKMMALEREDFSEGLEYLFRLNDEITNEIRKKAGEILSRIGINKICTS
jgi:predicted transcriptional regulator